MSEIFGPAVDPEGTVHLPLAVGKYLSIPGDSELVRFFWLLAHPASGYYFEEDA